MSDEKSTVSDKASEIARACANGVRGPQRIVWIVTTYEGRYAGRAGNFIRIYIGPGLRRCCKPEHRQRERGGGECE